MLHNHVCLMQLAEHSESIIEQLGGRGDDEADVDAKHKWIIWLIKYEKKKD